MDGMGMDQYEWIWLMMLKSQTLKANYKAQSLPTNKRQGVWAYQSSFEESDTHPEFNIALKNGGWKTKLLLRR